MFDIETINEVRLYITIKDHARYRIATYYYLSGQLLMSVARKQSFRCNNGVSRDHYSMATKHRTHYVKVYISTLRVT